MSTEINQTTWKEIYWKAVEAGFSDAVMASEENADDTVYDEKAVPFEDWPRIALFSLEDRLTSDLSTKAERKFFTSIGVRF